MTEAIPYAKHAMSWWSSHLSAENAKDGSLASALNRARNPSVVLADPRVCDLAMLLRISDPMRIFRLAKVLATMKYHRNKPLLSIVGGRDPKLSPNRFARLITMQEDDLPRQIQSVSHLADQSCNVHRLARDTLFWGEDIRSRWCFEYHHADIPENIHTTEKAYA